MLDDCGVDLAYIPYNVQCKAVISNINYPKLIKEIKVKLKDNLPKDDPMQSRPIVVLHKKGRTPEQHLVVMEFSSFMDLVQKIKTAEDAELF